VPRWRCDDITAVTANVDPGTEPSAGVVSHKPTRMSKVEVTTSASCSDHATIRQWTVRVGQSVKTRLTVVFGVDVEHD
jgi:hypothetical protein